MYLGERREEPLEADLDSEQASAVSVVGVHLEGCRLM